MLYITQTQKQINKVMFDAADGNKYDDETSQVYPPTARRHAGHIAMPSMTSILVSTL